MITDQSFVLIVQIQTDDHMNKAYPVNPYSHWLTLCHHLLIE